MNECTHPHDSQRSWAVIPNLSLTWCGRCGAYQFADHAWRSPQPQPAETAAELFKSEALVQQKRETAELAPDGRINIDARGANEPRFEFAEAKPQRFARCGNCAERLPLTGDVMTDHHTAMLHKQKCRFNTVIEDRQYSGDQYRKLIEEHAAQPMQIEFRQRAAAQLEAAEARERLQLASPEERHAAELDKEKPIRFVWWKPSTWWPL